jgi:CheY-like chemotaxis protein
MHQVAIADDDPAIAELIAKILTRAGCTVHVASNGAELVRLLTQHPVDVVVADIAMPWMTGLQVLRAVRRAGRETPFVLVTGMPVQNHDTDGVRVLTKPFRAADLRDAVGSALGAAI